MALDFFESTAGRGFQIITNDQQSDIPFSYSNTLMGCRSFRHSVICAFFVIMGLINIIHDALANGQN